MNLTEVLSVPNYGGDKTPQKLTSSTRGKMWLHSGTTTDKKTGWTVACVALHTLLLPAARTPRLLRAYLCQDFPIQIKHLIHVIFLPQRLHVSCSSSKNTKARATRWKQADPYWSKQTIFT